MTDIEVLVIGGGLSGLTVAHALQRHGVRVEVWEQSARPGGKIGSRREDGYLTERGASLCLNFRPEVNSFLAGAGLEGSKMPTAPSANRYLLHDGELVNLPMRTGRMLRSPLWSSRGKLRLALEPFIPSRPSPEESVSQFITRRLGGEMLTRAFEPFVAGPLASDPDRANAWQTLPRLTALERKYGSLTAGVFVHRVLRRRTATATESFSFEGGMMGLTDSLAQDLGSRLRLRHRAAALEPMRHGWRVHGLAESGGVERTITARQVVLSLPAGPAAALLAPHAGGLASLLQDIEYAPLSVVHLGFDRAAVGHALDGTGFLAPRESGVALNGCQWMSSLFAGRAPEGKVLLSCYLGGARRPAASDWSDARSVDATLAALSGLLGLRGEPEMARIDRHAAGLPLYHGAYHARVEAIRAQLRVRPGLHLAANYLGGVSVRDRIVAAEGVAEAVLERARTEPNPERLGLTAGALALEDRV